MKNFLITGGAGFVGSHIAEYLVNKGDNIVVLDDMNTGKIDNLKKIKDQVKIVKGDIRNKDLLQDLCNNIDGIFHQAARASVQESFLKPQEYFDVNVNGTKNIFSIAKENQIKVVYASSSSVYGNPEKLPIKEEDQKKPINPYAKTKLEKEKLAIKFANEGLNVIGLRYFNIFGERQSNEYAGVIKLFLERIQQRLPPKINGDGSQSRDFVYVKDIVMANILSMEKEVNSTFFNVGTGTKISILEIANWMVSVSGLNLKPIFMPPLDGDVKVSLADISHIQHKLEWKPTVFLKEWLKNKISTFDL